MTQDEKIYKETAKALIGYYSWHMDELLELYNAMGPNCMRRIYLSFILRQRAMAHISGWMDFILISLNCKITVMEISSQLWQNKKNKQMGNQTAFMENSGIQKTVMQYFRTVRKQNEFMTLLKPKGEIEYLHKEDTLRQGLDAYENIWLHCACRLSMRMDVMPDR